MKALLLINLFLCVFLSLIIFSNTLTCNCNKGEKCSNIFKDGSGTCTGDFCVRRLQISKTNIRSGRLQVKEERWCESLGKGFPADMTTHLLVNVPSLNAFYNEKNYVTIEYRCKTDDYCSSYQLVDDQQCHPKTPKNFYLGLFMENYRLNKTMWCACQDSLDNVTHARRDKCEWTNYLDNKGKCFWEQDACILNTDLSAAAAFARPNNHLQCYGTEYSNPLSLRCRFICHGNWPISVGPPLSRPVDTVDEISCNTKNSFLQSYCRALYEINQNTKMHSKAQKVNAARFGHYKDKDGCFPNKGSTQNFTFAWPLVFTQLILGMMTAFIKLM